MKNLYKIDDELYIISNTENVNENCWIITDGKLVQVSYLLSDEVAKGNKIILTTNKLLIKDGVQPIPNEFLEWFVKNPSCEEVKIKEEDYSQKCRECGETVKRGYSCNKGCFMKTGNFIPTDENIKYKIIIPQEEPKQETVEHTSKFIVFTLQDSEDWVQHSIPLDSFEKADNFCQQFRDKKMSYLICQTLKQGYNGN